MKEFVVIFLCSTLLLQGCMTDRALTREEREAMRPLGNEKTWFVLKDGRTIAADAFHHVEVAQPSDYFFIIGEEHNTGNNTSRETAVKIPTDEFNALLAQQASPERVTDDKLVYRLSDSTTVQFTQANTLHITPDKGVGFWCIGSVEDRRAWRSFAGLISYDDIEEIRVGKSSPAPAIAVIGLVGIGVVIFLAVLAEAWGSTN